MVGGGCVWQGSWARCVPSAGMWEGPELSLKLLWRVGAGEEGREGRAGQRRKQQRPLCRLAGALTAAVTQGLRVQGSAITDSKDLILSSLNLSFLSEARWNNELTWGSGSLGGVSGPPFSWTELPRARQRPQERAPHACLVPRS